MCLFNYFKNNIAEISYSKHNYSVASYDALIRNIRRFMKDEELKENRDFMNMMFDRNINQYLNKISIRLCYDTFHENFRVLVNNRMNGFVNNEYAVLEIIDTFL